MSMLSDRYETVNDFDFWIVQDIYIYIERERERER